jgi:hypothetical protein
MILQQQQLTAQQYIELSPVKVDSSFPVCKSHTFRVSSSEAETTIFNANLLSIFLNFTYNIPEISPKPSQTHLLFAPGAPLREIKLRKFPKENQMEVKAAIAYTAGKPLTIETVQLQRPQAGEVLIEIKASGIAQRGRREL